MLEPLLAEDLVDLRAFHHGITLRLEIGCEDGRDAIHRLLRHPAISLEIEHCRALRIHCECQHQQ